MTISAEIVTPSTSSAREVAALHSELTRYGLVVWTAGNVSARVPGHDLMVIKPSGVSYDDLDAGQHRGHRPARHPRRGPATALLRHRRARLRLPAPAGGRRGRAHPLHLRLRLGRPGEPIPCVLTMAADEFGGQIPVGPFAIIGDDSIGRGIVDTLRTSRSRGVLMKNHGLFTIGKDAREAVKAAVMLEDVARTVHVATQLGQPEAIPPDAVDTLYDRYQNAYGQCGQVPPHQGAT